MRSQLLMIQPPTVTAVITATTGRILPTESNTPISSGSMTSFLPQFFDIVRQLARRIGGNALKYLQPLFEHAHFYLEVVILGSDRPGGFVLTGRMDRSTPFAVQRIAVPRADSGRNHPAQCAYRDDRDDKNRSPEIHV